MPESVESYQTPVECGPQQSDYTDDKNDYSEGSESQVSGEMQRSGMSYEYWGYTHLSLHQYYADRIKRGYTDEEQR